MDRPNPWEAQAPREARPRQCGLGGAADPGCRIMSGVVIRRVAA